MTRATFFGGALVVLAFIGMMDSSYVGVKSTQGLTVPCGLAGGCDRVLSSAYSRIFGVSIAWIGFAFYTIIAGVGMFTVYGFFRLLRFLLGVSVSGFAFTLYLLYVQAFLLEAFCDYCLLSALLATLILGIHLYVKPWRFPIISNL